MRLLDYIFLSDLVNRSGKSKRANQSIVAIFRFRSDLVETTMIHLCIGFWFSSSGTFNLRIGFKVILVSNANPQTSRQVL